MQDTGATNNDVWIWNRFLRYVSGVGARARTGEPIALIRTLCYDIESLRYSKILYHWQMVWLHVRIHVQLRVYAQGISASANVGTRGASLRASACVGTQTCARVGVCCSVYAFVCEHARERACARACELVFVEFSGDGDGQPAAAAAETACRTSESPG